MTESQKITVREAWDTDLDRLVKLENISFSKDQFKASQLRYLLLRANSTVLVLIESQNVIGVAYLLWRKNCQTGRLYNISIDPAVQGQGLGIILLEACEKEARKRNCTKMLLEVRSDNINAIRFYKKHGYNILKMLKKYYSDGSDGLKMQKALI